MSATILLRAESGSSIGRSDCMLHNDSAGKDRGLDTVRSNIRTLPSAIGRSSDSDREDTSCFGFAMHSFWRAQEKELSVRLQSMPVCLKTYIIYQRSGALLGDRPRP
ncbi:MAG: hypothetical protein QOJ42_1662 [Acidobacteriaceae bacterium]|jgi:hypothetical protein|nr:hypothetical protein [Acidobacteriaceae bacterium]